MLSFLNRKTRQRRRNNPKKVAHDTTRHMTEDQKQQKVQQHLRWPLLLEKDNDWNILQ